MPDYSANELWSQVVRSPYPRIVPVHVQPHTIGAITGAPDLVVGTPMGFDENLNVWLPWTAAGSGGLDVVKGFIYPEDVTTSATEDVMGIIMFQGEIHYDDIVLPDGESAANLLAALQPDARQRGLVVTGLIRAR